VRDLLVPVGAKKNRGKPRFYFDALKLRWPDLRGLRAFGTLLDYELDLLIFGQCLEAATDDLAVMREQIGAAAVRGNEAKTLGLVEPLNFATSHFDYVPKKIARAST
jgi:hypothetical protein